jgi:protein-S-isoprenylcysteine O-methyltransferase Ste14
LTIVVSAFFPFAEEPWLREHYGEEYEAFRERTPRFVGWDLLTKLVGVS